MLYVNGIAIGVLELKRSTVSVAQGIRQNLDSQKKNFIQPFFSTVQLVMAGNDTEGLRYGVIETRRSTGSAGRKPMPPTTTPPRPSSPNSATSAPPTACSNSSTTSWSSTPASRRSAGTTSTSA